MMERSGILPAGRRVALLTGANQGIGLAAVELLLQEGITVILTARDETKGLQALESLNAYENCYFHQLDITDMVSIEKAKMFVEKEFGSIDILINNAAINYDTWQSVKSVDINEIEETLNTNLMGAWRVSNAFIPLMQKDSTCTIVNVSSGAGSFGSQTGSTPGYSLTKFALNGLTLQLSHELLKDKILVNSVCPGWVRTSMGGQGAPKSAKEGAQTVVWAALLEDESLTGKFFRDKKIINW